MISGKSFSIQKGSMSSSKQHAETPEQKYLYFSFELDTEQ